MEDIIGVSARSYPARKSYDGGRTAVTVVLVAGAVGDYAAYIGCGEPEWVAQHGDKLDFDEAVVHFPGGQLHRDLYRP